MPQLQARVWVSASERVAGSLEADFCFLSPSTQVVHLLSNTLDSSSGDNAFQSVITT